MEIGLLYSRKDPRQKKTRDFVRRYVRERGILAQIVEKEQPVTVPTITVDGCRIIVPSETRPEESTGFHFPTREDIARALDRSIWCI